MSDSLQPTRFLCPWASPGKSTGAGCDALLQGVFPTQGLSPRLFCLLYRHIDSLLLPPPGKPIYIHFLNIYSFCFWAIPAVFVPLPKVASTSSLLWNFPFGLCTCFFSQVIIEISLVSDADNAHPSREVSKLPQFSGWAPARGSTLWTLGTWVPRAGQALWWQLT